MNKSAISDRLSQYFLLNDDKNIETMTYDFINILNTYVKTDLRLYHKCIMYLHMNILSVLILKILCYKNLEELISGIDRLLDYVMNLYILYKI